MIFSDKTLKQARQGMEKWLREVRKIPEDSSETRQFTTVSDLAIKPVYTPEDIKNVLVGHIVALSLSVGFDDYDEDFGEAEGHLKDLIIADGHGFDGMNVADILHEANLVLGGGSKSYTPSQMTEILTKINEYFVDGKQSEQYKLFECK